MRITNRMLSDDLIYNLRRNTERLSKVQQQISSGKRFTRPSEDPTGVSQVLTLSAEAARTDQYLRNLDNAKAWLGATDTALSDLTAIVQRARELALQGSNDTMSAEDRRSIAKEVEQLLEHAVQTGNTALGGQYLFAGFQTDTAPFTLSGGPPPTTVTYNGDNGEIQRTIGPGQSLTINSQAGAEFKALFETLISLRDTLDAGNRPGSQVNVLDAHLDGLLELSTQAGARLNRVEMTTDRLNEIKLNLSALRSATEDTQVDEAAIDLMSAQNVYQAGLAAGAKVIQPSLLDYLR